MNYILSVIVIILLSACSKDKYEYTMDDLYRDFYIQERVQKELSQDERNKIDMAEKRYIDEDRKDELMTKTLGELIDEEKTGASEESDIKKITSIKLIDKIVINENGGRFLRWKVKIKNLNKKDIIKLQGWLMIIDRKSKEILRKDTIDSHLAIRANSDIEYETNLHDFNEDYQVNDIIKNLTIDSLSQMIEWTPVCIMFSDSSQMNDVNN